MLIDKPLITLVTVTAFKYDLSKHTQNNDSLLEFIQRGKNISVLQGVYVR